MATINNKLIYFKSKSNFNNRYAESTDNGVTFGDFLGTSIVFIQDAKEIWTHGQFFKCASDEEFEKLSTIGDVSLLETTIKDNLVNAVNELKNSVDSKQNIISFNTEYNAESNKAATIQDITNATEKLVVPYEINLTNLLSAEDSESISTAIGGIDNLNATVQDNRIIVGTISNGSVSVSIRILGNVTTLYYLLDSVLGLTLNEVAITNTSGTLSKSVTTHSVLTENMVINSLTSDETTLPLSAAQGKALNTDKQSKTDSSLETTNKTVVGAINEILPKATGVGQKDATTTGEIFNTYTGQNANQAKAHASHAEGVSNIITEDGLGSHAEGRQNTISAMLCHAEGIHNTVKGRTSHVEGDNVTVSGSCSHGEGYYCDISGDISHVEGYYCDISGNISHIEGGSLTNIYLSGDANTVKYEVGPTKGWLVESLSKKELYNYFQKGSKILDIELTNIYTIEEVEYQEESDKLFITLDRTLSVEKPLDNANYVIARHICKSFLSHVEGGSNFSSNSDYTHLEGSCNTAINSGTSHIEGALNYSSGVKNDDDCIHIEGYANTAQNLREHAQGQYNKSNKGSTDDLKTIHSIGIGSSSNDRKNAQEVMKNGNHYIYGIGGYDGTNAIEETSQTLQEVINSKQATITAGTGLEFEGNTLNVTLDTTVFKVVSVLPESPTEDQKKKICLVPGSSTSTDNEYIEYVWVVDTEHPDGYWEEIGKYKAEIDLSEYATKEEVNTKQSKTDESLTTTNKTIIGAINEINSKPSGGVGKIDPDSDGTGEIFNDYTNNKATGTNAHAEGSCTEATANNSHAEGYNTIASGYCSHVEGGNSSNFNSENGGGSTMSVDGVVRAPSTRIPTGALGDYSHVEGYNTTADNKSEHAQGQYNKSNTGATDDLKTIHSIGIGTSIINRKNAQEVMLNGDHYIINIGGYNGTNPSDSKSLQEYLEYLNKLHSPINWKTDYSSMSGSWEEFSANNSITKEEFFEIFKGYHNCIIIQNLFDIYYYKISFSKYVDSSGINVDISDITIDTFFSNAWTIVLTCTRSSDQLDIVINYQNQQITVDFPELK